MSVPVGNWPALTPTVGLRSARGQAPLGRLSRPLVQGHRKSSGSASGAVSRGQGAIPPMSEAAFQQQVTDLAELCGWAWVHFRPAQTSKGWRTPVSGPLGEGWPDLVLIRERILFVELKKKGGVMSDDQMRVREVIWGAGASYLTWWPDDFDEIKEKLR